MVLIKNEGTVIDKIVGYDSADSYLKKLKESVSVESSFLSLTDRYKADPDNSETAYQYAKILVDANDYKIVIPVLEKLVDVFDDPVKREVVYFNLGKSYSKIGQSDKAIEILERGINEKVFTQKIDIALGRLGELKFKNDEYDDALFYLKQIRKDLSYISLSGEWGDTEIARFLISTSYYKKGDAVNGKKYMDEINQNILDYSKHINFIDTINNKELGPEDKIEISVNLLAINGYTSFYNNVGIGDALRWTEKGVKLSGGNNSNIWGAHGYLLAKNGDFTKAFEVYDKWFDAEENDGYKELMSESYENISMFRKAEIAILKIKAGNTEEGELLIDELFNSGSEKYQVIKTLMFACNNFDAQIQEALTWAAEVIDFSVHKEPFIVGVYADLAFKNGEIERSIELLGKAIDLSEENYGYVYPDFQNKLRRYRAALNQ